MASVGSPRDVQKVRFAHAYSSMELTFLRVSLGLTIHAAELTAYTGLPRLMTAQLGKHADLGSFSDALFEADDAETWRAILMNTDPSRSASLSPALSSSSNPEVFLPMVLLAQSMVNLHMARELEKVHSDEQISLHGLSDFYRHMTDLARDHGFANMLADPRGTDTPGHQRFLSALFHYTCALRLTPMSLIEEGAGREGRPTKATMEAIKAWVDTPAARLATLHCGQLLHQASDLRDLGFILPR